MGAYFWASIAALVALAWVLWWGGRSRPADAQVALDGGGAWSGATLERGASTFELLPGANTRVPAGRYRVTLIGAEGRASVAERDLRAGETVVLDAGG